MAEFIVTRITNASWRVEAATGGGRGGQSQEGGGEGLAWIHYALWRSVPARNVRQFVSSASLKIPA
jgi:hypothetical protein